MLTARTYSFDNLIMRFEEPSSMARWDSPLFAISWDDDLEGANRSILDDLWLAVTQGVKKGPTAAVVTVSEIALSNPAFLTNLLTERQTTTKCAADADKNHDDARQFNPVPSRNEPFSIHLQPARLNLCRRRLPIVSPTKDQSPNEQDHYTI